MKKFIIQTGIFTISAILLGEIIIRVFNLTIDVPKSYRAESGLAKYYPNQSGKFQGGSHVWEVNKYGHSGQAPESMENLIILYGDSYIENFMNPVSCHQSVYLKKLLPGYNYYEVARAGATLIESFESAKEVDSLSPKLEVFYVNNKDFIESIASLTKQKEYVKVDLKKEKIVYSNYRESRSRDILYNFKLAYYIYRNIWLKEDKPAESSKEASAKKEPLPLGEIQKLMEYVKKNYEVSGKVLVFFPESDKDIIALCEKAGFKTFLLTTDNLKSWQLEYDSHWSCHGHEEVAKQVSRFITESIQRK